jgi:hypothetical protein
MPSRFPGMDPYIENTARWSGFHAAFVVAMLDRLGPAVRPKYFVRAEERVYVASEDDPAYHLIVPDIRVVTRTNGGAGVKMATGGAAVEELIPVVELLDPEVHEHHLEVIDSVDRSVVTVIELLSPTNKAPGSAGRLSFLRKRREIYASGAHWMEIDLLRHGTRTSNHAVTADSPYQVYLSRAGDRRAGFVLPVNLRRRLPRIGIPLRGGDADVPLDLQACFDHVYDVGGYDLDIDYTREPVPPLSSDDENWSRELLQEHE